MALPNRTMLTYDLPWILPKTAVLESFRGSDIVAWYGRIEQQLSGMVQKYEEQKNRAEADQIEAYLRTWRSRELTGSINVEDIEVLLSGAKILAASDSKSKTYFSALRDNLAKLKASEEELPRVPSDFGKEPAAPVPATAGRFSPQDQGQAGEPKPEEKSNPAGKQGN